VLPNHHCAAPPARLLTLDEAEERLRARQPWADLWRRHVRDTGNDTPQAEPAEPRHKDPDSTESTAEQPTAA
jgi:hypothetical protein